MEIQYGTRAIHDELASRFDRALAARRVRRRSGRRSRGEATEAGH